jgi:ferredoxin-thioredoxin reductase catalytic chain
MNAEALYDVLRKTQESRGFFFNKDRHRVLQLLEGLLVNKARYGYMSCPCRLAANDPKWDQDIICPCLYREPDLAEYGSCYCNLYVTADWNEGRIPHSYVPERRPLEKRLPPLKE